MKSKSRMMMSLKFRLVCLLRGIKVHHAKLSREPVGDLHGMPGWYPTTPTYEG